MAAMTRAKRLGNEFHEKGWGRENWLHNSDVLCVKVLEFNPGSRFSMHLHRDKEEVFYVLEGRLELEYRDMANGSQTFEILNPGDAVLIPTMVAHRIRVISEGPAKILEASTHHEDSDSYRVEPGDSQKG